MKKLLLLGLFSFFLIVGCDIINDNTDKANDNPDKITTDDDKVTTDDDKVTTDDDKVTTDDDKVTTDDDKVSDDDDKVSDDDDDKVSDDDDDKDYSYVGTWIYSFTNEDEDETEYGYQKLTLTKTTFVAETNTRYVENDGSVSRVDSQKASGTIQNLGDYTLRQILLKLEIDGTMYDVNNESAFRSAYEKENGTETDSEWAGTYKNYTLPNDAKYSISGNKMTIREAVYTKQ